MDQYRSRLKLSENFERHWSILISGEIHMDQSLVHTFPGEIRTTNGPESSSKVSPYTGSGHGWLFPIPDAQTVTEASRNCCHPANCTVLAQVLSRPTMEALEAHVGKSSRSGVAIVLSTTVGELVAQGVWDMN